MTGRKKELINRAGEKISPREIDEVLHELPAVELAAAVGVPDELYGEEVAAFVRFRPGWKLTVSEVIAHCRARLAEFKTPRRVFFISQFPKGPNGKIQRARLLEKIPRDQPRAIVKKFRVIISAESCKACGCCAGVCPREVFSVSGQFNSRGFRPMSAARPEQCVGCLACYYACPDFALDVEPLTVTGGAN